MRLMVFAAATDEILGLHLVRLMVFVGPASDRIFVPECQVCGLGLPRTKFWSFIL